MNPRPDQQPQVPGLGGLVSDIILSGGDRIRVTMAAEHLANGMGAALSQGKPFITVPRIHGDILISIAHVAAIEPVLQGDPAPEKRPDKQIEVAR